MGKGVGFGEFPREIPLSQIERSFYNIDEKDQNVLKDLPPDVVLFASKMMDIIKNELPYELNPNAVLVLADHISFAMERVKKHLRVKMPLAYDIRQMYPTEYKIAKYIVARIRKEFKVALPEEDRIRGLMAGGDDYLGKPYSLVELELRLRLRIQGRQNVLSSAVLCFDELEIDLGLREVRYNGERISFPPLEFELLAFLAQNPGQVFSYEQLYDHVWKSSLSRGLHNMQVCMARVRQKLKRICPKRQYIETIRQKGYLFRGEPETN